MYITFQWMEYANMHKIHYGKISQRLVILFFKIEYLQAAEQTVIETKNSKKMKVIANG